MKSAISKDGTAIAFDRAGQGPALILVDGAFCYRGFGPMPPLAALLAPHFTVVTYDRRGRGESNDTQPYAVEREIEDIEALISQVGGTAYLYGVSSGGALALEATLKLADGVQKLAIYEVPYNDDETARYEAREGRKQLNELLAADRRGDAVALFMSWVGMPAEQIEGMRRAPMWPMLEEVAPTLAYDMAALGDDSSIPRKRVARVNAASLVISGGASPGFMHETATALANAIPGALHRTLEGQTHEAPAEAVAPVLIEFFATQ